MNHTLKQGVLSSRLIWCGLPTISSEIYDNLLLKWDGKPDLSYLEILFIALEGYIMILNYL